MNTTISFLTHERPDSNVLYITTNMVEQVGAYDVVTGVLSNLNPHQWRNLRQLWRLKKKAAA